MSDIPLARYKLQKIANELRTANLDELATEIEICIDLMHRVKPVRRKAPITSRKMTWKLAQQVKAYAERYPKASNQQIAVHFRLNAARVSDAIHKHYDVGGKLYDGTCPYDHRRGD